MTSIDSRHENEIEHGKKLAASGNPEAIWYWGSPAGSHRAARRGRLLTEAAALSADKYVLEVGCGTGLFTEMIAASGARILAADISPELLELARQRDLPAEQVTFREMRFESYADDNAFDAVVGSSVLHHLDIPAAIARIYELLKPGGVMAFAEPNMLNPQIWTERNVRFVREQVGASPDETAIVRWKLAEQLQAAGFTDVHIRNTDWLHPATPKPLIPLVYNFGLLLEALPGVREFSGSVLIRAVKPL